jgi:ketosteroid isomerase-like protein
MTPDKNKHRVMACWRAFAGRDEAVIRSFFKPDAVWIAPPDNATALAFGAPSGFTGSDAIARFIARDFGKLFVAELSVEFLAVHAAGDAVIVEQRMRARLANGRFYENDYCFVFELEDGLIAVMREYMDTAKGFRMIFGDEPASPLLPTDRPDTQIRPEA